MRTPQSRLVDGWRNRAYVCGCEGTRETHKFARSLKGIMVNFEKSKHHHGHHHEQPSPYSQLIWRNTGNCEWVQKIANWTLYKHALRKAAEQQLNEENGTGLNSEGNAVWCTKPHTIAFAVGLSLESSTASDRSNTHTHLTVDRRKRNRTQRGR